VLYYLINKLITHVVLICSLPLGARTGTKERWSKTLLLEMLVCEQLYEYGHHHGTALHWTLAFHTFCYECHYSVLQCFAIHCHLCGITLKSHGQCLRVFLCTCEHFWDPSCITVMFSYTNLHNNSETVRCYHSDQGHYSLCTNGRTL
jgi:hypothetical protein